MVSSLSVLGCQRRDVKIAYETLAPKTPLALKAGELLGRHIQERTGLTAGEAAGAKIVLNIRPGIGTEGFSIEDAPGGAVAIVGNDERGLIYGVGKFIHTSQYEDGKFTPSAWRGQSVPKRPLRGIYFATHFFNFYHTAPVADVQRYVEELALWGCNTLNVWFDMHHFNGMSDPAAKEMVQRLRMIFKAANSVGIAGAFGMLANEGYDNSPEALRADWTAGHDGYFKELNAHYHREICPHTPGGLEYILKTRREMLNAFADLDIRYACLGAYDAGGCTCSQCAPWGANGFLQCAKPIATLVHEVWPKAKIVIVTWYFDHFIKNEWEAFAKAVGKDKPDFADYLLVDDYGDKFPEYPLQHGAPGGLPLINFPEISMYKMYPWGGYGANPLPKHLQEIWNTCGSRVAGGFPYSEGIFEDINKAINLQHYWGDRDAMDTVREYAAFVSSPEAAQDVTAAIEIMEQQHERYMKGFDKPTRETRDSILPPGVGASKVKLISAAPMPHAAKCLELIERAKAKMTPTARAGWRWRILELRAKIDVDIERTKGFNDAASDALYEQLDAIYFAQRGEHVVAPPSRQMMLRCFINGKI